MKVARSHLAIVRPGEEPWLTVYFPLGLSIHIRTTSISTMFVIYTMPQQNCRVLYMGPKKLAYNKKTTKCIIFNTCGHRQFTYEEISEQLCLHIQYHLCVWYVTMFSRFWVFDEFKPCVQHVIHLIWNGRLLICNMWNIQCTDWLWSTSNH